MSGGDVGGDVGGDAGLFVLSTSLNVLSTVRNVLLFVTAAFGAVADVFSRR